MRLELEVEDPSSTSGFAMGHLRLVGDVGSHDFHCMIVVSATLLMDQVMEWPGKSRAALELNPVDQSELLILEERRGEVDLSVFSRSGRQAIGRLHIRDLLKEILRTC